MLIVTWNMGCAFGSTYCESHSASWDYLRSLNPDLAMLQEVGDPPKWVSAEQLISTPRNDGGAFSTALYSAHGGLVPVGPPAELASLLDGQAVMAEYQVTGSRKSLVASVHAKTGVIDQSFLDQLPQEIRFWFPAADDRPSWHMDVILAAIESVRRRKRLVVGGDFNLANRLDDIHGPWSSYWGSGQFFEWARRCLWRRAHLKFHAGEERTFFRKDHELYQLDHFFVDEATYKASTSCDVNAPGHLTQMSDHAPLVLTVSG